MRELYTKYSNTTCRGATRVTVQQTQSSDEAMAALMASDDFFECSKLRIKMTKKGCIGNQDSITHHKQWRNPYCRNCEDGTKIRKELGLPKLTKTNGRPTKDDNQELSKYKEKKKRGRPKKKMPEPMKVVSKEEDKVGQPDAPQDIKESVKDKTFLSLELGVHEARVIPDLEKMAEYHVRSLHEQAIFYIIQGIARDKKEQERRMILDEVSLADLRKGAGSGKH